MTAAARGYVLVAGLTLALSAPSILAQAAEGGGILAQYALEDPPDDRWELPKALQEISGLAYDGAGRLFAHDDEQAVVYQLDPATHRVIKRFSFGQPAVRGDFEAIAVVGPQVVLTTSGGVLYAGREGRDGEAVPYVTQATGAGRDCEIEGMAYEPAERALLFGCKTPRVPALAGHLAVLRWSLGRKALDPRPAILIPLGRITSKLKASGFHPSELLRVPSSGHLLMLSGREHGVVEITPDGEVVGISRLRRRDHRQAEGLALGPDGSLLVSDEGAGRRGSLTVYRRK